jgi:cytoskeletal protein CcmA (bactofilin family)
MMLAKLFDIFSGNCHQDNGVIEINGGFVGDISKGRDVIIAPSGRFCGRIEARNLEIAGFVEGDICAENLVLYSSGQLYFRKFNCRHVSIKDGGTMVKKGEEEKQKQRTR